MAVGLSLTELHSCQFVENENSRDGQTGAVIYSDRKSAGAATLKINRCRFKRNMFRNQWVRLFVGERGATFTIEFCDMDTTLTSGESYIRNTGNREKFTFEAKVCSKQTADCVMPAICSTNTFTKSKTFSGSKKFTKSATFAKTRSFTKSATFPKTKSFTRSKTLPDTEPSSSPSASASSYPTVTFYPSDTLTSLEVPTVAPAAAKRSRVPIIAGSVGALLLIIAAIIVGIAVYKCRKVSGEECAETPQAYNGDAQMNMSQENPLTDKGYVGDERNDVWGDETE
jgi:hypothetical protein